MAVDVYSFFVGCGNACLVLDHDRGLAVIVDAGCGKALNLRVKDNNHLVARYNANADWVVTRIGALCRPFTKVIVVITHCHEDHQSLVSKIQSVLSAQNKEWFYVLGGLDYAVIEDEQSGQKRVCHKSYSFPMHNGQSYIIVHESEYEDLMRLGLPDAEVTTTNGQEFRTNLNQFCNGEDCILFLRTGGPVSDIHGQNIMVKYLTRRSNVLVFMGDAIFVSDPDNAIAVSALNQHPISWFQIPHHGSSTNGSSDWTRCLIGRFYYGVLSSLYGAYHGMPCASSISDTFDVAEPEQQGELVYADAHFSPNLFRLLPMTRIESFVCQLRVMRVVGVAPPSHLTSTQTQAGLTFESLHQFVNRSVISYHRQEDILKSHFPRGGTFSGYITRQFI